MDKLTISGSKWIVILGAALVMCGCETTGKKAPSKVVASSPSASAPVQKEVSTGYQPIQSELIYSVNYEPDTKMMTVILYDEGAVDYAGVPAEIYAAFLAADDHDAYFTNKVQKKYKGTKFVKE